MYRLLVESLLGLRLEVDKLYIAPRLPAGWNHLKMHYRYRETFYHIAVRRQDSHQPAFELVVDGVPQPDGCVLLVDDRREHNVELVVPLHEVAAGRLVESAAS
jgi:cellobiose phosphorylase